MYKFDIAIQIKVLTTEFVIVLPGQHIRDVDGLLMSRVQDEVLKTACSSPLKLLRLPNGKAHASR